MRNLNDGDWTRINEILRVSSGDAEGHAKRCVLWALWLWDYEESLNRQRLPDARKRLSRLQAAAQEFGAALADIARHEEEAKALAVAAPNLDEARSLAQRLAVACAERWVALAPRIPDPPAPPKSQGDDVVEPAPPVNPAPPVAPRKGGRPKVYTHDSILLLQQLYENRSGKKATSTPEGEFVELVCIVLSREDPVKRILEAFEYDRNWIERYGSTSNRLPPE